MADLQLVEDPGGIAHNVSFYSIVEQHTTHWRCRLSPEQVTRVVDRLAELNAQRLIGWYLVEVLVVDLETSEGLFTELDRQAQLEPLPIDEEPQRKGRGRVSPASS